MKLNRKRAAVVGALVAAVALGGAVVPAQAAPAPAGTATAKEIPAKKLPAGAKAKNRTSSDRASATTASGSFSLGAGDVLGSNEYIETENGVLYMQPDGNLILDHKAGAELWASGTYGNPGAYAIVQPDGNFVIYKQDGGPTKGGAVWNTGTWGNPNARVDFQDDANLVLYRENNSAAWSTKTWRVGSNTLTGGQNLERGTWMWGVDAVVAQDNRGYFGVFFRNEDKAYVAGTYSVGAYTRMQTDGNLVIYKAGGGEGKGGANWNTGTWGNPGAYFTFDATTSAAVLRKADGTELGHFGP
ncbi:hypothetical protein [Streptomyces antimicrobicus]|uniref:Bulb-type lectin domain-containing protein n=1 Tax=Streptomyces antimicrobicus TaxID=2883108 RepID=A0ABS8B3G6_9ACTN|nr:hypothetical protein [Streptomyces antimicrobicus]MCB5179152.1 hypothetical protein [Streptomyces antimicrobicus]